MKTKHTPGPWKANDVGYPKDKEHWVTANQSIVARIGRCSASLDEHEANARLIAESPTMYEALQDLIAQFSPVAQDVHERAAIGFAQEIISRINV